MARNTKLAVDISCFYVLIMLSVRSLYIVQSCLYQIAVVVTLTVLQLVCSLYCQISSSWSSCAAPDSAESSCGGVEAAQCPPGLCTVTRASCPTSVDAEQRRRDGVSLISSLLLTVTGTSQWGLRSGLGSKTGDDNCIFYTINVLLASGSVTPPAPLLTPDKR